MYQNSAQSSSSKNKAAEGVESPESEEETEDEGGNGCFEQPSLLKHPPHVFQFYELAHSDLHQLIQSYHRTKKVCFPQGLLRSISRQLTSAVAFCHRHGLFHRDLKPANVLIIFKKGAQGGERVVHSEKACKRVRREEEEEEEEEEVIVKLADFGLSRSLHSLPCPSLTLPRRGGGGCRRSQETPPSYTEDVVTLWYRSPELLLHLGQHYHDKVDAWSLALTLFECVLGVPLCMGCDSEFDTLVRLYTLLGSPTDDEDEDENSSGSSTSNSENNSTCVSVFFPSAEMEASDHALPPPFPRLPRGSLRWVLFQHHPPKSRRASSSSSSSQRLCVCEEAGALGAFLRFLKPMLAYYPLRRATVTDMLRHEYLEGREEEEEDLWVFEDDR